MRKSYLLYLLLIGSLLCCVESAKAIMANPNPQTIQQPDGTTLTIRIHGDENFRYITTIDGYMIKRDADGYFKYVGIDTQGKQQITAQRANNIDLRNSEEQQFVSKLTPTRKLKTVLAATRKGVRKKPANILDKNIVNPTRTAGEAVAESQYLVILVNFCDKAFSFEQHDFDIWLNEAGYSVDGGTGSVKDYYRDNSMGQFIPNFTVLGPYTLSHEQTYYAGNIDGEDADPRSMVVEAITMAKEAHPEINFAIFDNDKDGNMDNVNIIYAGYSEASTGNEDDMWPHSWTLGDQKMVVDDITINNYACSAELVGAAGTKMDGIGTFTHEFGHVLGLKDMYDTDEYTGGYGLDPGDYSLFASGSYNNDSRTPPCLMTFERVQMGWCNPVELNNAEDVTLRPLSENEARYINAQPNRAEGTGVEWFILENRQKTGWDAYIPAHGLLIYHYDYTDEMVEKYWSINGPNNNSQHRCMYIKCADGIDDSNTRNGDTYPGRSGNTAFTDETMPNALNWNEEKTNTPITNIREEKGIIYFQVNGGVIPQAVLRTEQPSNIRDTSVEISGTVINKIQEITEMGFCWALGEEPTIESDHQSVTVADQISYTVTGLLPGCKYNIRAYMKQADGSIIYGAAIPFATECEVAVAPYIADFTSWTDGEPDCWKIIDNNSDGTTWIFDDSTGGMLYQFDYWNNADDWLISTRMLVPENGSLYFVRGIMEQTTVEKLDVYVSTHSRDISDFHLVKKFSFADNFGYQVAEEVDLKEYAGQEIYIAFVCRSEKLQSSLWLWEIYLTSRLETPEITKFDKTDTGLYLEWTPIKNATRYFLEFSEVTDETYTNAVFVPTQDYDRVEGKVEVNTGTIEFTGDGVVETREYPDGIIDCMFVYTTSGPTGTTIVTVEGTTDGINYEQVGPSLRASGYDNVGVENMLTNYVKDKNYRKLRISCQYGGRNVKIKYFTLQYNDGKVWESLSSGYVLSNYVDITERTPGEFLTGKTYAAVVYSGDGNLFYDASKPAFFSTSENVSPLYNDKTVVYSENNTVHIDNIANGTHVLCTTPEGIVLYNNSIEGTRCSITTGNYSGVLIIRLMKEGEGRTIKLIVNN